MSAGLSGERQADRTDRVPLASSDEKRQERKSTTTGLTGGIVARGHHGIRGTFCALRGVALVVGVQKKNATTGSTDWISPTEITGRTSLRVPRGSCSFGASLIRRATAVPRHAAN